jgi:rare lipoprotein A
MMGFFSRRAGDSGTGVPAGATVFIAMLLLASPARSADNSLPTDGKAADHPAASAAAPVDHSGQEQVGEASFYGKKFVNKKTASGQPLDPQKMTAASPTLPLGTKAEVINTETGKSVDVTINDRGPYEKGRILDVTPKAAEKLGMKADGVSEVAVKPLAVPQPDGHILHPQDSSPDPNAVH